MVKSSNFALNLSSFCSNCAKTATNTSPHPSDPDQTFPSEGAEESEAVDEGGLEDQPLSSKSSTMEEISTNDPDKEPPSNLVDIFGGTFQRYEDDWSTDRESEISIPERLVFKCPIVWVNLVDLITAIGMAKTTWTLLSD